MHGKIMRIIPLVLILVIVAATVYYFNWVIVEQDDALQASGTVEVIEVIIAPEIGGRIEEIFVDEGGQVEAGDTLVRFNDALLLAQLDQAEAAQKHAQANYDLIAASLSLEKRQASISTAELELVNVQQALDDLYENLDLARAAALQAIADARDAVRDTQRRVDNLHKASLQTDIEQAEANVILAKDKLDKAIEDYEPYENKPEDDLPRAAYLSIKAQAQAEYDNVVRYLNNLTGETDEIDLAQAEADLEAAQAHLADAQRQYEKMADGPDPDALALAEARLKNAQSQLTLAQSGASAEELAVAQAQIDTAQSAVAVIRAQLDKLVLSAPMDGRVLYRSVEPGEVVQPGVPLLTLARLDNLTITVYVPEDRYGEIMLGQIADVTVDSFPGEIFDALVVRIADEAEFTPRNVQTAEGRRTTVFAVKLSVESPEGRLKPGMPADVVFGEQ
ncbi:MAG: efflux RND transporter periplasmic adaptor subunit [Anaerolineales bacterium]|nr:efflux RND transporter periplasmic adaptor subunit [Anaerolineales bacterium]